MAGAEPKSLGRYRIERVLGKGAMGVVYEGFDPRLNRRVAVKTILKSHFDEETARDYSARFEREAKAVGRLNHPHIVQVHDFGEEGDIAYLVMEFIQGAELKSLLDAKETLSLAETVRIMCEVCDALDFAHKSGIVHRDVKPANIMLDSQKRARLTDFGVARIQDITRTHVTQTGAMVGTPAYMSPEQISGAAIDARSDVFSTGIVLYQLLTGELPFGSGGAWTIAKKIMQDQPAMPSSLNRSLPPCFDPVVNRALAKDPGQRYQSARELEQALKAALAGESREPDPEATVALPAPTGSEVESKIDPSATVALESPAAPSHRPPEFIEPPEHRESPLVPILTILVVVALGAGIWLSSSSSTDADRPKPPAAKGVADEKELAEAKALAEKAAVDKAAAEKAAAEKAATEKAAGLEKAAKENAARSLDAETKERVAKELARLEKVRAEAEAKKALEPRSLDDMMRAANGFFAVRNYAQALTEYRAAAERNQPFAQFRLGYMYEAGLGVTKDYAEAMRWYLKSADQNNADAQNNIGSLHQNGLGVPRDYTEALRWYRKAADQNHALAQNSVGVFYYNGWGVTKDPAEAITWYRKAAEKNLSWARNNLGIAYQYGSGVEQNYVEALRWYRLAADQNHAGAQTSVGTFYHNGSGVPQDYVEAMRWYRKAAEQNNPAAQNNIGLLYMNGLGVAKDDAEASKWFKKAAEQNNPSAIFWVGFLLENGRGGVAPDREEARRWYQRAADLGNASAKSSLQRLDISK